ncbi:transcription initiation factor IIB [Halobacteriales archaeon SW_7_71_33]|nr:MAG: transcription initiation factor IIB [Halobacteriales archaeon SW_7_71_33]
MSRAEGGCPECSGRLRATDGETVCVSCGLVVAEDRVDRGPEWRVFDADDRDRIRTGAPRDRSRHDRGLSTEIGRGDRGASGRKRRRLARLRRQHDRTKISSKAERNQVYGFTEIRRVVSNLDLPRGVRDGACRLFESAQDADLLRGRSIEGFAAAAVYATCRTRGGGTVRTEREVCEHARADVEELRPAYDALNRELGLPTGPIDPREYLARFACALDLPGHVESRAREIAAEVHENGLAGGRDPTGVAGACLYAAADECDVALTQAEAAEAADVSPVTLRGAYYALPVHD